MNVINIEPTGEICTEVGRLLGVSAVVLLFRENRMSALFQLLMGNKISENDQKCFNVICNNIFRSKLAIPRDATEDELKLMKEVFCSFNSDI